MSQGTPLNERSIHVKTMCTASDGSPGISTQKKRGTASNLHALCGSHMPEFNALISCDFLMTSLERCQGAWSPSKKQWCCTQKGKGCEGPSPPHVDPGFGMVWKHVQAWSCFQVPLVTLVPGERLLDLGGRAWQWLSASKPAICAWASLPPPVSCAESQSDDLQDCHAGLQNFQIGWSSGKRAPLACLWVFSGTEIEAVS